MKIKRFIITARTIDACCQETQCVYAGETFTAFEDPSDLVSPDFLVSAEECLHVLSCIRGSINQGIFKDVCIRTVEIDLPF